MTLSMIAPPTRARRVLTLPKEPARGDDSKLPSVPEKRSPDSPSTDYDYPAGNRGGKSGRNLQQNAAASGDPHPTPGQIHRDAE